MRVLDLFSGIGGFSLGLERAGMQTVAFCEIEPYARRVLAKHWPDVPIHPDVTTREFIEGEADVITAGFPCQDLSLAGAGAGLAGKRSGLYRHVVRAIRLVRPKYAILENVAALLGRGLGTVLGDLAESGQDAEWDCFPTCLDLGHRRERVSIVAYPMRKRLSKRRDAHAVGADGPPIFTRQRFASVFAVSDPLEKWSDRPLMGRGISGVSGRVGRVTGCGNSFRPQIPEIIGRAILEAAP